MMSLRTPRVATALALLACSALLPACASSAKLAGTWTLESMEANAGNPPLPPPGRTRPTVTFEPVDKSGQGKVTGFGGVNRFFGNYSVSGGSLAVGSLGASRMAGPTELMTMEKIFLGVLQSAREWKIEKSTLEITGGAGKAVFAPAKEEGAKEGG